MWHLPLGDIRVIDLTIARAGPTCVRQLADWGADVIRVEPPPGATHAGVDGERHGSDFQNLHRNKRSLTLDLKSAEGRDVLLRLVDTADVLVENMRPPVKHRLGFDYDDVHAATPGSSTGRSPASARTGPYADRGGVDQIAQGMGGLMSVTGLPGTGRCGPACRSPTWPPVCTWPSACWPRCTTGPGPGRGGGCRPRCSSRWSP